MTQLNIPDRASSACILFRHAGPLFQEGERFPYLSQEGMVLIHEVQLSCAELINAFFPRFGDPAFITSPAQPCPLTAGLLFYPSHVDVDERLNSELRLLGVDVVPSDENPLPASDAKIIGDFVRARVWRQDAMIGESFPGLAISLRDFIRGRRRGLSVVFTSEPGISLAACDLVHDKELGLDYCDGMVFYLKKGGIVGAEKIVPKRQSLATKHPAVTQSA